MLPVLDQDDVDYIKRFEKMFWEAYATKVNYLSQRVQDIRNAFEDDRKKIALEGVNLLEDKSELRYVFGNLDGKAVSDQLFAAVHASLSNTKKYDVMKTYLGLQDVQ